MPFEYTGKSMGKLPIQQGWGNLLIVKRETLLDWYRQLFKLNWRLYQPLRTTHSDK
jgi:hypothetical protein